MKTGKLNIVTDACFGSCGKGLITSSLAARWSPSILSTTNQANAGHTVVTKDGRKFVAKALPSAAILNAWVPHYNPTIYVGASAGFTISQMLKEIEECDAHGQVFIHPRAGVITEEHRQAEAGDSERSTKHLASTMQGCGAALADKVLRRPDLKLARDYPELGHYLTNGLAAALVESGNSIPEILMAHLTRGGCILHEGAQGYSLDINHGLSYPHCTSRGTTAMQNLADLGLPASALGDVYLVVRPTPIRVGNVVENGDTVGYSGDAYPDQKEITWKDVAESANMPQDVAESLYENELTTVTKRLRRVFTFSEQQFKEAALVNNATKIALNFANYIDWDCAGTNDPNRLTPKVWDFIHRLEDLAGIPVAMVGTGAALEEVIYI